ncbi:V-snare-domain-containing protein [Terfezia boudieri ATCC MYA-4762]|uniref:Golgi SNAP receptor complex member 1 n=1 Tax=Terfezia boudieri ATCC MYA-4762 TaxID=1051890 RepID=A0A3N4M5X5_9PEZI|nr:V-snare-domain-containing protein [Terfezia boudieri ATCC MYA-4762]
MSLGWAQLRQQARSLESQTENLFHSYSSLVSPSLPLKPSDDEVRLEQQIQEILHKRETTIASLSRTLESESGVNSSAAKLQNLVRHKEILTDHNKEFQRIKNNIHSARERASLLSNVRNDIDQFHSASREDAEFLLDERNRLDNSHNMADSVLSQAYAINQSFADQRAMLGNINRRVMYAASQIPGINTIISKINTRKKRDSVILAVLISICFLLVIYFR